MRINHLSKKKMLYALCAVVFAAFQTSGVWAQVPDTALPQNPNVTSGSASFNTAGNHLEVATGTPKTIIDWNTFNIGQSSSVNFNQPNASSTALNRVSSGNPSEIAGSLTSNGRVWVVNPNGVVFGPHSHVDTAGLLASTLDIRNQDFLDGKYNFYQNGKPAWVVNQGQLNVANGGYVALLSNAVNNSGSIQANLGKVALASGEKMTVPLDDANGISVVIDDAVKNPVVGPDGQAVKDAIKNTGSIVADGGKIQLNARVLQGIFEHAVNNSGLVQANTLVDHNGVIELLGDGSTVLAANGSQTLAKATALDGKGGKITYYSQNDTLIEQGAIMDVSGGGRSGDAGSIELSAKGGFGLHSTQLYTNAAAGFKRGVVLIDPLNIVIQSGGTDTVSGDNAPGTPDEPSGDRSGSILTIDPASLQSLTAGEIYLQATQDIFLNSDLNANTSVRFEAGRDIVLNALLNSNSVITLVAGHNVVANHITSSNSGSDPNDIDITAQNDISVGDIESLIAGGGVSLNSVNGSINNINSSSVIRGDRTTLIADKGIGSSDSPIHVIADNLNTGVSGTGSLYITDADTLIVDNALANNGSVNITTGTNMQANFVQSFADAPNNNVNLTTLGGSISYQNVQAGPNSGAISLSAPNGNIQASTGANPLVAGTLNLTAGSGAGLYQEGLPNNGTPLQTSVNTLNANITGNGSVNVQNSKALTIGNATTHNGSVNVISNGTLTANNVVSSTDLNANLITLTAQNGDIVAGNLNAGPAEGDIILNAPNGSIIDDGNASTSITADHLLPNAASGVGVGANGPLTGHWNIFTPVTSNGDINAVNTNDEEVTINNMSTGNGSINYTQNGTGDLTLDHATAGSNINLTVNGGNLSLRQLNAGGAVNVTAANGSISHFNSGTITAGASSSLNAPHGTIGVINSNPIDVNINGGLSIGAGAATNGVSADLTGTVVSGPPTVTITPPGDVRFNGAVVVAGSGATGGDNTGGGTTGGDNTGGGTTGGDNTGGGTTGGDNTGGGTTGGDNTGGGTTGGDNTGGGTTGGDNTGGGTTGGDNTGGGIVTPPPVDNGAGNPAPTPAPAAVPVFGENRIPSQFTLPLVQLNLPDSNKLSTRLVNSFDLLANSTASGSVFLYHPLTEVDSGAFDNEFQLDEGAYDFIDGRIQRKTRT